MNGADAWDDQLLSHGDKVEVLPASPHLGISPSRHQLPGQLHVLTHVLPQVAEVPPPPHMMDQYSPGGLTQQTAALRN